jgi:hypothetical protein
MIRGGTDIAVAMRISGHRTRSTFDRYNIVSTEDLRAAVNRTAAQVSSLPVERIVGALTPTTGSEHGRNTDTAVLRQAPVYVIWYLRPGMAEAGGNRTHRSGGQPGAERL